MRKIWLLILFSLLVNSGFSQRKLYKKHHIVNKVLKEIVEDNDFKNAGFGFYAIDTKTGQVVAQHHPDKALRPASNQKLITTATALELYGPEYKFETKLEYTGEIDTATHILHGNIIIKGGGDPTLGSKYFDQTKDHQFLEQWLGAVKLLGIDSVTGAVIADAGIFSRDIVPVSWSWTNIGTYYGAGACGLSIFDNYFSVYYNSDSTIGDTVKIAKVEPDIPYLIFNNGIVGDTISNDESNIMGAPYCNTRYLRGRIPLNKTNYREKGALPDPAYYAAYVVEKLLQENGVGFKEPPVTVRMLHLAGKHVSGTPKIITTTYSPTLSEIISQTNIHSVNLFAEHLLDLCGLKLIQKAETEADANAVIKYWKAQGMDVQGMNLTDGSGLSQYNAVTARQMVFLLNFMKHNSTNFDVYYNSLPVAGKTGTVENMFKGSPAEGNLRAKSGTIDRVKAYSGFVKSRSGREIAFSMIVNSFSCKSREATARLERLMTALAELKK
jgi:D-alanyl-D-alanine carboxypeptidase/D-alanyl-D-alanine-endopeptidase (penicillin-binding protein 4)